MPHASERWCTIITFAAWTGILVLLAKSTYVHLRCWLASDGLLAWAHRTGRRRRNLCSPACLVVHHTSASSSACGPSPLSSGRRIAFRRVAEIPAPFKIRRDRPLPTLDFSFVYLGGLEVVVRKKMSPELSVQRSARERLVKACEKFGIPLNPTKSLVDAVVGPV